MGEFYKADKEICVSLCENLIWTWTTVCTRTWVSVHVYVGVSVVGLGCPEHEHLQAGIELGDTMARYGKSSDCWEELR